MQSMGEALSDEELENLLKMADQNNDGKIQYDGAFLNVCCCLHNIHTGPSRPIYMYVACKAIAVKQYLCKCYKYNSTHTIRNPNSVLIEPPITHNVKLGGKTV